MAKISELKKDLEELQEYRISLLQDSLYTKNRVRFIFRLQLERFEQYAANCFEMLKESPKDKQLFNDYNGLQAIVSDRIGFIQELNDEIKTLESELGIEPDEEDKEYEEFIKTYTEE